MSFIVVGAGLFGSIIAAALRARKAKVTVVDDARPGAGSPPAACLMKPGWYDGLGDGVHKPALSLLDALYGVHTLSFKMGIAKVLVKWCKPAQILKPPDRSDTVRSIRQSDAGFTVLLASGGQLKAKAVIVAAGIWTPILLPQVKMTGQAGVACLWRNVKTKQPTIQMWNPYRQLVCFDRGDGMWVGEGSAIRWSNWTPRKEEEVVKRCCDFVGRKPETPIRLFGVRPYTDRSPCWLEELQPNLWAATGGAKNGTIAAAWCASELVSRYA